MPGHTGAGRIEYFGYADCIELKNGRTRVVLGHQCGGRVLEYSLDGINAIYLKPDQRGWLYREGEKVPDPCGGRYDIGKRRELPPHPLLWVGPWKAEATGERSARLTSVDDPATGLRLVRDFSLDAGSSRLEFTQTMINVSGGPRRVCAWSRTFAAGHGICVVPAEPGSRYPEGYLVRSPEGPVEQRDPAIVARDGYVMVIDTPRRPWCGFDSRAGRLAYCMPHDHMFVKRWPVEPDRSYGDEAPVTLAVWYKEERLCELEPFGPIEELQPGRHAAFTENWWLLPWEFPAERSGIDPAGIDRIVESRCAFKTG